MSGLYSHNVGDTHSIYNREKSLARSATWN